MRVPRSLLAVPASDPRLAAKALASEADAVFLDLEDAVAPHEKAGARQKVLRAMEDLDWRGRPKLFRANALDTPFFYRDLIEVVEGGGAPDAVMIPKVNNPADLYSVATLLGGLELACGLEPGRVGIEAQIESAEGLLEAAAIARSTQRLAALHFGPGDFAASVHAPQTSIGTMDEWDRSYPGHRFHYAMHHIVISARAAGVRALDGPVADYRDEGGLKESCLLARSLGFDGKWCIHPAQIGTVNEVFSPTEREIEWAKGVVEAYERANAAGSGATSVGAQMVDAASVRVARNTLDVARESGPD